MHWITSTVIALFAIIGMLRAERELFVFDNAFSDIKSPDEQAALLKKLGYDGICTRPQNATPEFFAAMDTPHFPALRSEPVALSARIPKLS